jgi:type III secretory pathway component EscV
MAAAKSVSSGMRPRFPLYVLLLMSFCLIVVFLLLVCEEGAAASHGGHAFT